MSKTLNCLKSTRAFDVFCGVGGLTYGLRKAGITVKAGLDIDASCRYAYEKNCSADFIEADIRKISFPDISKYFGDAKCKILVGCAPCQPFSTHKIKMESNQLDPRWDLINEFLRIILEGKPEVVFMENVPHLIKKPIYEKFKRDLTNAGYKISDGVVSCADYGVPQSRRRLIMLASLLDEIDMPKPKIAKHATVREKIGELPPLKNGESDKEDHLHKCAKLAPINLQRIQISKPGGNWKSWPDDLLPDCYKNHKQNSGFGYKDVYGRMQWDKLAPTLTTNFFRYATGRYGHPDQDRALSLREGALLQTFPNHYQFFPSKESFSMGKIGRHIGNAVPPSLAFAIGKTIAHHIEGKGNKNV